MNCTLKDPNMVPPGDFAYMQPETGVTRNGRSLSGTIRLIMEHRQSNRLPRQGINEVTEDVQKQICQRIPANFCHGDCSLIASNQVTRDQVLDGVHAVAQVAASKLAGQDPFVSQAEADRRAAICANCFLNDKGNYSCVGCSFADRLRGAMKLTIGNRETRRDGVLQVCRVCGCLNKVSVWYSADLLRSLVTDEQRARYAQVPNCWKAEL